MLLFKDPPSDRHYLEHPRKREKERDYMLVVSVKAQKTLLARHGEQRPKRGLTTTEEIRESLSDID